MQSRFIRLNWSLKPSHAFGMALMVLVSMSSYSAEEIQPQEASDNPMLSPESLTELTVDRVLERGVAVTPEPPPYGLIEHVDPVIPEPIVVPPEAPLDEEMIVFENGIAEPPPKLDTWVVYQDNSLDPNAESEIFRRINSEYTSTACLPGFDCPIDSMVLPEWPEDVPATPGGAIQVFDAEDLIPLIDPIPELRELPFPDSEAL